MDSQPQHRECASHIGIAWQHWLHTAHPYRLTLTRRRLEDRPVVGAIVETRAVADAGQRLVRCRAAFIRRPRHLLREGVRRSGANRRPNAQGVAGEEDGGSVESVFEQPGRSWRRRDWLDVVLATIATGVVVGAAVALLAELFGDPLTIMVGVLAGVASGVATLFVAGTVVSLRRR